MRILIAVLLFTCTRGFCQEPDAYTSALHYDYGSLYGNSSAWLSRHNADYKYTDKNLSLNAGVSVYETDYNNTSAADARAASITSLYTNVAYNLPLGDHWGIMAEAAPKLISELKNSGIKDLYPGFYAGFTYNPEKKYGVHITLGAGYNGYFGKYRFMPMVNLSGALSEKLSYNIGLPNTWFGYRLSDSHTLKAFASADGFYSRIGGAENIFGYSTAQNGNRYLEMSTINTGVEYVFSSGTEWSARLKTGYSIYNKLRVYENGGHSDTTFNNNLYFSAGFTYNLNFK